MHKFSIWFSNVVVSRLFVLLLTVAVFAGCTSSQDTPNTTLVSGTITISPELSGDELDFSGIELLVITGQEQQRDTLLSAVTDIDGHFSNIARVTERGAYPLIISRNNRVVYIGSMVLAPGDTVSMSGELPELDRNLRIDSRENRAMATYDRLQRLYGRVATLAFGGVVSQDSIPILMNQWSDLFWSMRSEHSGTYASNLASIDAIDILEGWNDLKVLERLDELDENTIYFTVKLTYGGHVRARVDGVQSGVDYLNQLRRSVRDNELRRAVDTRVIELMVDYGEYDMALDQARQLARNAASDQVFKDWLDDAVFRLENLMPGRIIPSFTLTFGDETVEFPSQQTTAVTVLEVVLLADRNYQQSYPELQRLYRSMPEGTASFFTIPLDQRQVTINAFFEERTRNWPFASSGAYEQSGIIEMLRIEEVPTRIVLDRDGRIIARLVGHDLAILREELNTIIQTIK